jgi:hypothetical protein
MIAVLSVISDASHAIKSASSARNDTGIRSGYRVFFVRSNNFARKCTDSNKNLTDTSRRDIMPEKSASVWQYWLLSLNKKKPFWINLILCDSVWIH